MLPNSRRRRRSRGSRGHPGCACSRRRKAMSGDTRAFPVVYEDRRIPGQVSTNIQQGMTLRDYFAAKAMQTMCRNGDDYDVTAECAYRQADAMLKACKK